MTSLYKRIAKVFSFTITLLLFSNFTFSQTVFTGKVLDASTQIPLQGVSVTLKNSSVGTAPNSKGEFKLLVPDKSKVVFSFLGHQTKEVASSGSEVIIELPTFVEQLNEVVVTATGIKKESRRLGYSLQTVNASAFTKAREADPISALKGTVSGLQVNINSEIGHPSDVIVRGENGSVNRPLFVVDGVPISTDTYNLNSDDIETYTVLKGPNAAALYGFQGKNGAIIITTKKGAVRGIGLQVTFNASMQMYKGFIALPKYNDSYGPGDNGKYAFSDILKSVFSVDDPTEMHKFLPLRRLTSIAGSPYQ